MSQRTDTSKSTKAWPVSQHTDTSKNTKAWAVSQHTDTSKNTKAWAVSQHTDTSKNTKAWAVSQHTDTSKNTKAWAVSQHTDTSKNAKTTLNVVMHCTVMWGLSLLRTAQLCGDYLCYALHSYVGTVFSPDKLPTEQPPPSRNGDKILQRRCVAAHVEGQ